MKHIQSRRTGTSYITMVKRTKDNKEWDSSKIKKLPVTEEFYSINQRVADLVLKLNKRYNLKVVRAYAPTYSGVDELVESFYEGVESAVAKVKTQYNVMMRGFNAKVRKKKAGDLEMGEYGILAIAEGSY